MKEFDAKLKAAAFAYCAKTGWDPNFQVPYDNGTMMYTTMPRWMHVYEQLEDLATKINILKESGFI